MMRRHVVLGAVVLAAGMGLAGCSLSPTDQEAAAPATVTTSVVVTSNAVQTMRVPTTVPTTVTVPTTATATKTEISTSLVTITVTEAGAPEAAPPAEPEEPAPALQQLVPEIPEPEPVPDASPSGPFGNCTEARAAGAAPVYRGQPGYSSKLDRDGDGVGCE
jgi:hypothetical protein